MRMKLLMITTVRAVVVDDVRRFEDAEALVACGCDGVVRSRRGAADLLRGQGGRNHFLVLSGCVRLGGVRERILDK